MTPATTYAERAGQRFVRRLNELGVEETGETAEDLADRAALIAAAGAIWEDAIGPLLTSGEARMLLGGISREALSRKVKAGIVLRLRDERGRIRYPAWQFDVNREAPYPVVAELITRFRKKDVDEWMLASFCAAPQPELDARKPAEVPAESEDPLFAAAARALAALTD